MTDAETINILYVTLLQPDRMWLVLSRRPEVVNTKNSQLHDGLQVLYHLRLPASLLFISTLITSVGLKTEISVLPPNQTIRIVI